MTDKHIINKDGNVATVWAEGSPVEEAIRRELFLLQSENDELKRILKDLREKFNALSKVLAGDL